MSRAKTTKTTLYLDDSAYRSLKKLASARGGTAASLVREAVAEYVARHAAAARPASIGAGRSGRADLSENAEDLLDGLGAGE